LRHLSALRLPEVSPRAFFLKAGTEQTGELFFAAELVADNQKLRNFFAFSLNCKSLLLSVSLSSHGHLGGYELSFLDPSALEAITVGRSVLTVSI